MGKRKSRAMLLLMIACLLTGCVSQQQEAEPVPSPTPEHVEAPVILGDTLLAETARNLILPYESILEKTAAQSTENLSFTIPGGMLNLLVQDAASANAAAKDGYYRFSWRQGGEYAYETTVDDVPQIDEATPDPQNETPMDSQLNGDYAVSGGGLFERVRSYDVRDDLLGGRMEISDSLNSQVTGHEFFSYSVRDGLFYFVDATLNITINQDGEEVEEGFLAAVGVLREDSLDIVECVFKDPTQFPDPASMDWARFSAAIQPVSCLSAQGDQVTVTP